MCCVFCVDVRCVGCLLVGLSKTARKETRVIRLLGADPPMQLRGLGCLGAATAAQPPQKRARTTEDGMSSEPLEHIQSRQTRTNSTTIESLAAHAYAHACSCGSCASSGGSSSSGGEFETRATERIREVKDDDGDEGVGYGGGQLAAPAPRHVLFLLCSPHCSSIEGGRGSGGNDERDITAYGTRDVIDVHQDRELYRALYAWRRTGFCDAASAGEEAVGAHAQLELSDGGSNRKMVKKLKGMYAAARVLDFVLPVPRLATAATEDSSTTGGADCIERHGLLSCGKVIAILQHWAYHDRLIAAVEAVAADYYQKYTKQLM